ncbi:bifunctional nicotinamidase/pyrazinamidase [Mycoplana rhizolycopersici]|jgi:nicotinamidase/pyrazinamidase|uniref:nicotinamidase n=1 Tax=Mycoplana rhizolycopersici TaxID=2746702 RepID=A0ABX2QJ89_9HYPH|nr:bifunctional nicotinamidase/pyrazinamidase [Rhizobium rhizolycopersici]NVP56431.1 bifunctional nicotinamidase/pyrazinamidase [Rhizobium rhizolycopersici]
MKCLLLIDLQNGFCPGGNLAVPGGDEVIPIANRLMEEGGYDLVVASQDWHPAGHGSFASSHPGRQPFEMGELKGQPQVLWPDHCVEHTDDAALHPKLDLKKIDYIQKKGMDRLVDSYSAFRDNDRSAHTGLADYLKERDVTELDIGGLATDYCVQASAIDAVEMLPGVRVRFVEDLSRGIDPATIAVAERAMAEAGVATVRASQILAEARGA